MAKLFRLSYDHSLPTHTINYILSVHICLPFQWPAPQLPIINEMSNKREIANPSHQLHFIVPHPHPYTLQQPTSWLPFINNVPSSYYSLDYISPCFSPNHFKQLQWGFQLIRSTLFCEHFILSECQPGNTSSPNLKSKPTTKANNDFDFQQYSSYLTSIRPINWNQLLL